MQYQLTSTSEANFPTHFRHVFTILYPEVSGAAVPRLSVSHSILPHTNTRWCKMFLLRSGSLIKSSEASKIFFLQIE